MAAFLTTPDLHCLFIPGDPRRNLETADATVILPELCLAFRNAFDCALVDDAIETALRERYRALTTPRLPFFRRTDFLGATEKVRDWSDYLARTTPTLPSKAARGGPLMVSALTLPQSGFGPGAQPAQHGELCFLPMPSGMRTCSAHVPMEADPAAMPGALALLGPRPGRAPPRRPRAGRF